MTPTRESRLQILSEALRDLTDSQVGLVETVVAELRKPASFRRTGASDLINDRVLQDFGDVLRIHHCFSRGPFGKDKFEYALERVLNLCEIPAGIARTGNPGHDITINGQRFSLKSQAAKATAVRSLHISKFMELGKGQWTDQQEDFIGLREQFFNHLQSYDRILSLRKLRSTITYIWRYELVEIPKSLLLESRNATLTIMHDSNQWPKPAYYSVTDSVGAIKFQLYFDAGREGKLQIRRLNKAYCFGHAEWMFGTSSSESDTLFTLS
jgi:hypothetical protein